MLSISLDNHKGLHSVLIRETVFKNILKIKIKPPSDRFENESCDFDNFL